jgi:putative addiction module component (TIGR02574 family)
MTMTKIKQEALALKPQQRLRLVQDIWDSLIVEPQSVHIPDVHRRVVSQRLAEHRAHPSATLSLAQAKKQLSNRSGRRPRK